MTLATVRWHPECWTRRHHPGHISSRHATASAFRKNRKTDRKIV